jgi:hypothetical protein
VHMIAKITDSMGLKYSVNYTRASWNRRRAGSLPELSSCRPLSEWLNAHCRPRKALSSRMTLFPIVRATREAHPVRHPFPKPPIFWW